MKIINIFLVFLLIVILLSWYSCSDATELNPNQPPIASFSFVPENADTSVTFTFDASESSDMEDAKAKLLFRWDFEGTYSWTDPVKDPIAHYKYLKSGVYSVGLKVIDTEGWSDEVRKNVIVKDSI